MQISMVGMDLAENVFQVHGSDAYGMLFSENGFGAIRFCRSFLTFCLVLLRLRPVAERIAGVESLASWAMKFGFFRRSM